MRRSTLKPGVLPPARKKASRMRAARWKATSAAPPGGRLPSGSGRKVQVAPPVSTSGARR
jgi:hypothetical protein